MWKIDWPKENGYYWFYGARSRHAGKFDLFIVRMMGTSRNGIPIYICNGAFMYPDEGSKGYWQRIDEPEYKDLVEF